MSKSKALSKGGRRLRTVIKRFIYSQLYLRDSFLILFGKSKPLVRFTVEDSPPSLYLNFAIPDDRIDALAARLELPHPVSKIACVEGEEPFHCLTLNVYRVSGLANGIRAEWSMYVRDPGGTPRYIVVEAETENRSMDPVGLFTQAGDVSYREEGDRLVLDVASEAGTRFKAELPKPTEGPPARSAPEWVVANDYIYWRNGVCDRTFYDAGLAHANARSGDPGAVEIENDTAWAEWIEPVPRSVIAFQDAIEFAMSPWWNIDELG